MVTGQTASLISFQEPFYQGVAPGILKNGESQGCGADALCLKMSDRSKPAGETFYSNSQTDYRGFYI